MIKVSFINEWPASINNMKVIEKKPLGNVICEVMGYCLVGYNSYLHGFLPPSTEWMKGGVIYYPFVHTKDLWVHICHCSMFKLYKGEWGIPLINSIISRLQLQIVENEWPIIPKSLKKYWSQHFLHPSIFILRLYNQ